MPVHDPSSDTVDVVLDALNTPSTDQVLRESKRFSPKTLAASAVRLAKRSDGGSLPFSGVSLAKNVDQVMSVGGAAADIPWQVENYDTDAYFTAPGTLVTIPAAGYYLISCTIIGFDADGVDGQIYLHLVASDGQAHTVEARYAGGENEFAVENTAVMRLAAAVTVKATAKFSPDSGGTDWQINGSILTCLTVSKLGAVA